MILVGASSPLIIVNSMIELLAAAYIIGQAQVGPNMLRTDYINEDKQVITIEEVIQEVPTK